MNKENTGILIRNARTEKGLTQLELSDILGVSNKAVSRWECGETFPDVALLDHLASTLDLSIEELVVGEKTNLTENAQGSAEIHNSTEHMSADTPPFERTYKELVHAVKIQRRERIRQYKSVFTVSLLCLLILLESLPAFFGQSTLWSWGIYSISLAAALLLTGSLAKKDGKTLLTKTEKILSGISVATFIYAFVLMLSLTLLLMNDMLPTALNTTQLGPAISYQLLAVWLYNFITGGFLFTKLMRKSSAPIFPLFACETSLFLTLFYRDILGNLQAVKAALTSFLCSTGLVLVILLISVTALVIFQRFGEKSEQV